MTGQPERGVSGLRRAIALDPLSAHVNLDAYLMRGDSLRAQAATGHSITLGYIFAMAIACWLHLRATQISRAKTAGFFLLM